MEIFGEIYCWFESLFGVQLAEHLWGWSDSTEAYSGTNLFVLFGALSIITSLLACFIYYYLLNHPRFNRWWSWLIILLVTGTGNAILAYYWTYSDLVNENISKDLAADISSIDCIGFGLSNFIVTSLLFVIFSFILKWWSRNCKYSPF